VSDSLPANAAERDDDGVTNAVEPLIADNHWADPGGRSVDALKTFIGARTGQSIEKVEVEFIHTVGQFRRAIFGKMMGSWLFPGVIAGIVLHVVQFNGIY
jgi:hypothetical protein